MTVITEVVSDAELARTVKYVLSRMGQNIPLYQIQRNIAIVQNTVQEERNRTGRQTRAVGVYDIVALYLPHTSPAIVAEIASTEPSKSAMNPDPVRDTMPDAVWCIVENNCVIVAYGFGPEATMKALAAHLNKIVSEPQVFAIEMKRNDSPMTQGE